MIKVGKTMVVVFPADQYPSEFVQPCKQTLDRPSPLVATQHATILGRWLDASFPMRRDYRNTIGGELCIARITAIGTIPDKSRGQSHGDTLIDGGFDKGASCGRAEAVCTASGRPAASVMAMTA